MAAPNAQQQGLPPFPLGNPGGLVIGGQDPAAAAAAAAQALAGGGAAGGGAGPPAPPLLQWELCSQWHRPGLSPGPHGPRSPLA